MPGDDRRDPSEKDDEGREDKDCAHMVRNKLVWHGSRQLTGNPVREEQPDLVVRGQFVHQKCAEQGGPKHDRSGVAASDDALCGESDAEPDSEDCANGIRHSQQWIHMIYRTAGIRGARTPTGEGRGGFKHVLSTTPSTQPSSVVWIGVNPNWLTISCLWFVNCASRQVRKQPCCHSGWT